MRIILPAILVLPPIAHVYGQEASTMRTISFRGLRPTDPGGRQGLRNPERGLRVETLVAEPPGSAAWGPAAHLQGKASPGYSDEWWVLDCGRYEPHGLTLAQTYCYLDPYVGQPLPPEKLEWLQGAFDALRSHGLKAVLRFAYERDMDRRQGPSVEDILGHLDQLAPLVRQNADVIFVLQAGCVGAWGEWHSSARGLEQDHGALARITQKVLSILPPELSTQVRVPKYKRWVLAEPLLGGFTEVTADSAHNGSPAARIGFHNDGFLAGETCGGTWPEAPHFSSPGNPEFDLMTRESAFVPVDGELFWSDLGGKVEGLRAAIRLRLHHYTSLSLAHSYSEREGQPYSIDDWLRTPLTAEQLAEARMPVSDGYFQDDLGQAAPRTQFEYIRDHLGYRLELRQAVLPTRVQLGDRLAVELTLINRGFAAPQNPRPVCLALIGPDGDVLAEPSVDADLRRWQPCDPADTTFTPLTHTVPLQLAVPADALPGQYRVALWLPDPHESLRLDPRQAIRVANGDVLWWTDAQGRHGLNVLGSVDVQPA